MTRRHETDAVPTGSIYRLGALLLVFTVLVLWLMHVLWQAVKPPDVPLHPVIPAGTRLQPHATDDLARFKAIQAARRDGYRWSDATHAAAQVPVARAMQMLEDGRPAGMPSAEGGR